MHTYTVYLRMFARSIGAVTNQPELHHAIPKVKGPKPRTVIITPEELSTVLANASPWFRVLVTLAAALGLRHAEALDVRPSNYDPTTRTLAFTAKGGERQTMPATEEVAALFQNAPPGPADASLIELYRGSPVNRNSTWWEWKKLKQRHGIRDNLTIHDLRRTLAVTAYELTKDLRLVWQVLRHKNLSTTTRYLEHVDHAKIRPVLDALWTPKGPVQ